MSDVETDRRVHLPSLAVELPEGWTASERAVLRSPAGTEVHAQLDAVEGSGDVRQLLDDQIALARTADDSVSDVVASTATLGRGIATPQVAFRFGHDVPMVGRIVCWIEDGLALTVTATAHADRAEADDEIDRALSAIRLLHRPLVSARVVPLDGGAPEIAAHRDPADLAPLRAAWSVTAAPAVADLQGAGCWSAHELAIVSSMLGSPTFPTVPVELMASLTDEGLDATVTTVARSLTARGLLGVGADGRAELNGELASAAPLAVFPDLAVSLERTGRAGIGLWWFGIGPGGAIQVTVLPGEVRAISLLDPARLVAHALALGGVRPNAAAGDGAVSLSLGDVVAGSCDIVDVARLRSTWRAGDRVVGGECVWAIGSSGELWLADDETGPDGGDGWVVRGASLECVRDAVVGCLTEA